MTSLALLLLLAPAVAREPVGNADWDRIEDPLERRVASLLAGEPVSAGLATIVPLYARVPSEAGEGSKADVTWAAGDLCGRVLIEEDRVYLRITNPTQGAVFLAAGTVFAEKNLEVAVARDAILPPGFAALVPAAPLGSNNGTQDLGRAGLLTPAATGALLLGMPAFNNTIADARSLRGEESYLAVLASGVVVSRRDVLATRVAPCVRGLGGTAVGAVFLVGNRPVAAHVFARFDLFLDALPDLLRSLAVAVRDEEIRVGPAAVRQQAAAADARGIALAWLREAMRVRAGWSESYGAGFETLTASPTQMTLGHAVVDQRRVLVHAGFYALQLWPQPQTGGPGTIPDDPPNPPGNPNETPTGFRERRPRPTVEDERRGELNPNPGPNPGGATGSRPDPAPAPSGSGRPR